MRYRLYQPADFEALYTIEKACFQPPLRFPRAYMRQLIASPRTAAWLAEDDQGLAGFAVVEWHRSPDGQVAYIETIEVTAARRGQGIGTELLGRVEQSAHDAGARILLLHVDAENAPAIRLYEAQGFAKQGREEDFYGQDRPALVYAKMLTQD